MKDELFKLKSEGHEQRPRLQMVEAADLASRLLSERSWPAAIGSYLERVEARMEYDPEVLLNVQGIASAHDREMTLRAKESQRLQKHIDGLM